jgi:apolipoprotein N-acyltransferase
MYKEAEGVGMRLSWQATVLNFLARLLVSLSFVAIVLVFSVAHAIPIAMVWGILLVILLSYWITISVKLDNKALEVGKHLLVALVMIVLSRYVGLLIAAHFPQA